MGLWCSINPVLGHQPTCSHFTEKQHVEGHKYTFTVYHACLLETTRPETKISVNEAVIKADTKGTNRKQSLDSIKRSHI